VAVEFIHPVLVGKRAHSAVDLSASFEQSIDVLAGPDDIVMAFGWPERDAGLGSALARATAQGAFTMALPGEAAAFAVAPDSDDPFVVQEIVEILYHTLWETVHVFLEHGARGHDLGQSSFLYPYLGTAVQDTSQLLGEVAGSIRAKAAEVARLRTMVAAPLSAGIIAAADLIRARTDAGGTCLLFGNGGSATDANDWALDMTASPKGYRPRRAISLAAEPATLSAVANDIGADAMFLRPLIAHASDRDVVAVVSTSGNSRNVLLTLVEARRRKLPTIALLGHDGGDVVRQGLADVALVVPCDYIPRIQEVHASLYHLILDVLR
jgi:D-sedoheptulose 7-phosphate isomerase